MVHASRTGKKRLVGEVLRKTGSSTITVKVATKFAHPLYKKVVETWKNYSVHTTKEVEVGDRVVIEETRPISKTKTWRYIKKAGKKDE